LNHASLNTAPNAGWSEVEGRAAVNFLVSGTAIMLAADMTRTLMIQIVVGMGAIAGVGLILLLSYQSWRFMSASRALRQEIEASAEHSERLHRMHRWLLPYLRPLGWKRVPLDHFVDLPHIQNKPIKAHLHERVEGQKRRGWRRKWWSK
jgi:hypothetical protein